MFLDDKLGWRDAELRRRGPMGATRRVTGGTTAADSRAALVDPTLLEFEAAARMHLRSSAAIANHDGGEPKSAAYLAHVATECALKRRILAMYGKTRTRDVAEALGVRFRKIFASTEGHALEKLAEHAALRRLLEAETKVDLLASPAWKRMTKDRRPYSLRYATEGLSRAEAEGERTIAEALARVLLGAR